MTTASDAILDEFARLLARVVADDGWTTVRFLNDGSDRSFELRCGDLTVPFLAKLSQSQQGFWGVTFTKAEKMLAGSDHLLLLTAASRGYVIGHPRLAYYLKHVSRTSTGYRINEREIRRAPYCVSIDRIWSSLKDVAGV